MEHQETSIEAYESILPYLGSMRAKIIRLIEYMGGASDWDVEKVTGMKHQSVSGTRRGLVLDGVVRDSGRLTITDTGRAAIVWEIVPEKERFQHAVDCASNA